MQAAFLFRGCEEQAADYTADEYDRTEPHIDQRHGQCAEHQACEQKADSPINEFPFKAFENKGLLKPLINSVLWRHLQAEESFDDQR
ncbi:hypothetical protein SAMN05192574_105302 [Mucilaginibacter gossypiicola]|uniref:Uncharacterized protein n=1 Tax=Mucilaginibacter gossypiicola TaxID=551995 RepID=A0A1H8LY70_9SPHI|nr:hypothetical protein SAMN05192574_105302 [Mucilaginibacter gossypiicola]